MATPVPERETISIPPDGRPAEEQPAWRQDFPIDWPQDHYVERRDFVKFLTLTSPRGAITNTRVVIVCSPNWNRLVGIDCGRRCSISSAVP